MKAHLVDFLLRDALAYVDEQGRVEKGHVRKLLESAHVLHVGGLTDDLDGILVGKVQLVLDNHRTNDHACRLVSRPFGGVVQTRVVDLLQLSPGKSVAKYHPAVDPVQIVE